MGQPSICGFFLRVQGSGLSLGSSWPCLFPALAHVYRGTFKEGACPLWVTPLSTRAPRPIPGTSAPKAQCVPSVSASGRSEAAQSLLSRFSISSLSNRIAGRWLLFPSGLVWPQELSPSSS